MMPKKYNYTREQLVELYNAAPRKSDLKHLYNLFRKHGITKGHYYHWQVRTMNQVERSWLACAIDGEGWIHAPVAKSIEVGISKTNRAFLEKAQIITGVGAITVQREATENHKTNLKWAIHNCDVAKDLLRQITPYLVIKREKAEILLGRQNRRNQLRTTAPEQVVVAPCQGEPLKFVSHEHVYALTRFGNPDNFCRICRQPREGLSAACKNYGHHRCKARRGCVCLCHHGIRSVVGINNRIAKKESEANQNGEVLLR